MMLIETQLQRLDAELKAVTKFITRLTGWGSGLERQLADLDTRVKALEESDNAPDPD